MICGPVALEFFHCARTTAFECVLMKAFVHGRRSAAREQWQRSVKGIVLVLSPAASPAHLWLDRSRGGIWEGTVYVHYPSRAVQLRNHSRTGRPCSI